MRKNWKGAAAVFAALATVLLLAACSSGSAASSSGSATTAAALKGPIVVGSKIDGEGALLGQIILQTLQANGFKVEDKTRTGATKVVRQALLDKQIDIYPEYTANGILVFHGDTKVDPSILQNADLTYQTAKSEDATLGVDWLTPAPANNTWAVALPKAFADANKIATLDDLAKYVNGGGNLKIVGSQEFFTSAVAFPAFEKAYGFKLKPGDSAGHRRHSCDREGRGDRCAGRQRCHGLRHGRHDQRAQSRGARRPEGCPTRLSAGADHP